MTLRKRTVTITIEVDLISDEAKTWEKKTDYFESEVNDALNQITKEVYSNGNAYDAIDTKLKTGTKFTYKVRRSK